MSQINEIGKRFDTALSVLNLTNKQIAEDFNTSSQNISNLKKTDKINDLLSRIAVHYGININWLMTGKGEMLIKTNTQEKSIEKQHGNTIKINNSLLQRISEIAEQYEMSETEYINFLLLQDIKKETHQTQGA